MSALTGLLEKIKLFLSYVQVRKCLFHIFEVSAFSFNFQYILLFLKSSSSSILLLNPSIPVIIPQWHHGNGNFHLRLFPVQLSFLRNILFHSQLHFRCPPLINLDIFSSHYQSYLILPLRQYRKMRLLCDCRCYFVTS